MASTPLAARINELRKALDEAENALTAAYKQIEDPHYDKGISADHPETAIVALATMGNDWMRFQSALTMHQGAFTRYMAAMDEKRQKYLHALETAAEERAKESAAREARAEKLANESAEREIGAEKRTKDAAEREIGAETRAKEAAEREIRAEARERFVTQAAQRETHWIKWATIVIAIATVAQTGAAIIQICRACR